MLKLNQRIVVAGFGVLLCLVSGFSVSADEQTGIVLKEVVVTAQKEKRKVLPIIEGAKIYSGKKTAVIDLEEAPTIVNSNYRHALGKTPGLLLSEESTPLLSVGYRGLDPHRAQFTQVLKDGIPIHADMFGYPEAYYVPPLETVDQIDFIHGGAALLYGPQPGGALNFVTKDPYEGPFSLTEENSTGSHGFYSNYSEISGTQGHLGYYTYFHNRQSQGFRDNNSQFNVYYGGTKLKVQQAPESFWTLGFDSYNEKHGEPGGLTRANFDNNSSKTTRLNDHFALNRYAGSIGYTKDISPDMHWETKTFGGSYERLSWRQRTSASSSFGTSPIGANALTNDIEDQRFYTFGTESRLRKDYAAFGSSENALTGGILYYHVTSPRLDKRGATADAQDGTLRKDTDRGMDYVSLFAENLFKFGKLSLTPGVRLENIWQSIKENINLDKTTVALADESEFDFVPLLAVGTAYQITPNIEIYHNISQGYRPKIFTQAVPTGNGQVVNDDLEEGKSWQTDLGVRGSPKPYYWWDASAFYMEFKDQIGTVGSTGVVIQNVGDAQHYGFEMSHELDLVKFWDSLSDSDYAQKIGSLGLFSNVMFVHAEFTEGPNSGKTPAYAPDYVTRGGVEYRYLDKGKLRFAGTFVDDHFANDSNSASFIVPSYKVWDLTGEWKIFKNTVSLFGGVNNLFDEHYFARVRSDGIDPADGRNYYAGVKLDW